MTCFRSSQLSPAVAPNHLAWSAVHPTIVVEDSFVTAQPQPPHQTEVVTLNIDSELSKTKVVTLDSENQQLQSPASSPSWSRRFGEYSEPSSPLRSSPPTGLNSPTQLTVIVQNPFPLIRANSAPGSLAIAPSVRHAINSDQGRQKFPLLGVSAISNNSLDWDSYSPEPSFSNTLVNKIPIINTPSSSLGASPLRLFDFEQPNSTIMSNSQQMATEGKKLLISLHKVETLIKSFPTELMTFDRLETYNLELKDIRDKFLEFSMEVLTFSMSFANIDTPPLDPNGAPMNVSYWKDAETTLQNKVNAHQLAIRNVASELHKSKGLSDFERQDLELKRRQIELLEKDSKKAELEEKEKSLATATKKYDEILAIDAEMDEFLDQTEDWDKATRSEVITAMKSLDKYGEKFSSLNKAYREFNFAISKYDQPDLRERIEELLEATTDRYKKFVEDVKNQDKIRELYSLAGANSDQVTLPKFSGNTGEDFFTFKKKLLVAFEKNRVPLSDKVEKLRSCLAGQALALVPEKTKDFKIAIENLEKAYGNPEQVLQSRMSDIKKLGRCPPEVLNSKRNFSAIVSFCLKVEVLIQDIIDLAEDEGCDHLKYDAYGSSTRQSIQQLFNLKQEKKMRSLSGRGKDGLLEHLKFISQLRAEAQTMVDPGNDVKSDKVEPNRSTKSSAEKSIPGVTNFTKLKKFEECRVCGQLEAEGVTVGLYENHASNFTTGCPKFQAMSCDERRDICIRAKICLRCSDPKVIHSVRHRNECRVTSKQKFWYTCTQHPKCLQHSWVCGYHRAENKAKIEDFSKKKKINPPVNVNPIKIDTVENAPDPKVVSDGGVKAMKNMRRNLKKKGSEVVDIPEGVSVFMLAPLKGVTRPVNAFFDSGCSDACIRSGVPGSELHGVCVDAGPIPMLGVGGIKIDAKEEWIVKMRRKDKKVQLMKGFTMEKVCAAMPVINTEKAVAELKSYNTENLSISVRNQLQHCKVPSEVGGEIDVIIGNKYNNIHPVPLHTLECGLTIYSMTLETHNPEFNACIGGPHKSFSFLLNQTGGLTRVNQTLQLLHSALDNYHKFGPPKIEQLMLKDKSSYYAKKSFSDEFELNSVPGIDNFNYDTEIDLDEVSSSCQSSEANIHVTDLPCACTACYHSFMRDDDKLRDLKHWFKQIEGGLTVDYRCPSCRECPKCKDADTTEKISMREESEQKAIEDSVTLDTENKKIVVSLPKRGKEEQFLTSNRDIALKVLDGVCRKAATNEKTVLGIQKALEKLFTNGHAVYLHELSKGELDLFIHKPVQFYLPWRVVYKLDSLSTPIRPVFDGSTNTRKRSDGSGGRSLNDLLCKGRIDTLNLLKMFIRFSIGSFAVSGDFQQFYCSCKLIPQDYNLVRFLIRPNLDPKAQPVEAVFKALIFGLKSASAQSECSKVKLADLNKETYPQVATLLTEGTYVDDMGESKSKAETVDKLIYESDIVFSQVNLKCKEWIKTGHKPSENSSSNGISVFVAGMEWCPQLDSIAVKIPFLHFGKKKRGKLSDNTEFFHPIGNSSDLKRLDEFCPKLTRRICASKSASIFDLPGLLAPILAGVKCLMRDTVKATSDWDDIIPVHLRNKWLEAFLTLEKLRGISFERPVMPLDAVDTTLRLISLSDAAEPVIMVGVWGGFLLSSGDYSCRLVIGRSLLSADMTIPKLELEGCNAAANLNWFVRKCLKDWPQVFLQGCDSTIALSWITSEELRLSQFHRNRVGQVRRALVSLDSLYHVRTDVMAADCGTRPDKVCIEDILPGSKWHNGVPWMSWPLQKAIDDGCIKLATDLRLSDEEQKDFQDGVLFEKVPELLTRGHALNQLRVSEIEKRARFSNYVLLPTKFGLKKFVGIMNYVFKFIVKCRKYKPFNGPLLSSHLEKVPTLLTSAVPIINSVQSSDPHELQDLQLEEVCYKLTGTYLFRKTSAELKEFTKKSIIDKQGYEANGIIYSKNRLLETVEFNKVTGMELVNLDPLGVNVMAPLIDRYSPVSYAVAQYVHWEVSKHGGLESCNRLCLERVHIIQGFSLHKELSLECAKCCIKRKKFLEVSTGPAGEHQLTIAPPMFACQADLFGPLSVYVPGFSKQTRNRPTLSSQVWVIVFACPVTRLVNCQVIEKSDASAIIDGVTRLAADYGFPKYLMIDKDSAVMKALREAEVCLRDLQHTLYIEKGIIFTTCSVGGHNEHGHVERSIKSIQELLADAGIANKKLHATGLQTLLKLVENNYNSLPLGYSYDRSMTNTPLLRIITPNFFRMGRNNNRALDGPVKLPAHGGELIDKVNEAYQSIFKLWCDSYVPRLIYQPSKWNKDDVTLNKGDLVYFKKEPDKKLSSKWIIGMIEDILPGRDKKNRKVIVKYVNEGENRPQTTERSIRTLIKIHNVEEYVLQEDLAEVLKRLIENPVELVDDENFPLGVADDSSQDCSTFLSTSCSNLELDYILVSVAVVQIEKKHNVPVQQEVSFQSFSTLVDCHVDVTADVSSSSDCGVVSLIRRTDLNLM